MIHYRRTQDSWPAAVPMAATAPSTLQLFVVVASDDGFVAVNFANPQQTRDMYAELRPALDRSR